MVIFLSLIKCVISLHFMTINNPAAATRFENHTSNKLLMIQYSEFRLLWRININDILIELLT